MIVELLVRPLAFRIDLSYNLITVVGEDVMQAVMERFSYDDKVVKAFAWATVIWGLVGFLVGLIAAIQLYTPLANFNLPWISFGRLRPLHTNAAIFAFCGNAIFAGIYYSSQRLLKARMASDFLSWMHFWGWQLIIVSAAITLPLGLTTTKEYAELEWPIKIAIALIWVVFAINFFWTVFKRREPILYVAIWFYMATIITVAMLHIINGLALPVTMTKSYPVYAGIQDALVQWWYGHNAVAFFLTTPFLGLAYYFIPKAAETPIYSYRLSIIHFWSLIFIYIWAGPHHLQYSSVPEWLQSLGVVFSVMLLAPSWGGAINFVLTLRNAWHKVRHEATAKFFAAATTFYMMSTFEGPLLSVKSVNLLSHNTDWTVAHVHGGTLGWNGFLIAGMLYWMIPKLYNTKLYSNRLANIHFWTGLGGIVLYIVSMWVSGVLSGLMALKTDASGSLVHPNFLEIVVTVLPLHAMRAAGGFMYILGYLLMIYNLVKTYKSAPSQASEPVVEYPAIDRVAHNQKVHKSFQLAAEHSGALLAILSFAAVAIGGIMEIVPLLSIDKKHVQIKGITPYTALEVEGRDIYMREGCNNCHTQQVRPVPQETKRYGAYSRAGEFVYDYPHLWGSKRTGPDLARIGGKYGHAWHWKHMINPQSLSPGSVMPAYPWLAEKKLDTSLTQKKLQTLRKLGVPYTDAQIEKAPEELKAQANQLIAELKEQGETGDPDSEMVALVSYLQRLGADFKRIPAEQVQSK